MKLDHRATAIGLGASLTLACTVHVAVLQPGADSPCAVTSNPVNSAQADAIVGDGTPESCTEAALDVAIGHGGVIRFDCGTSPHVIGISAEKIVRHDTVIDGGGIITLDGGGSSRLFVMGASGTLSPSLTLQFLTLRGGYATATAASADGQARAGGGAVLQLGGRLVVTDSVLEDNVAIGNDGAATGGAICSLGGRLVVARSRLERNQSGSGGAIAAFAADLLITQSQLTNNQAVGRDASSQGLGGAVRADQAGQSVGLCQVTLSGNQAAYFGTALHLQGLGGETVTIDQAAILNNLAPESTSSESGGPAVFLGRVVSHLEAVTVAGNQGSLNPGVWVNGGDLPEQAATVRFSNVTIADNRVYRHGDPTTDGVGAALWIEGVVRGELINCTLAGNLGEFGSGIVHPGQLQIRNTIIANQGTNVGTAQNCSDLGDPITPAAGTRVLQWPVETVGSYLCATEVTLADPLLGPLADNGGYAPTMMPAVESPAVGAGIDCPDKDQRGRVRAAACTLGAVEVGGIGAP
jgi:hypothetical protein